MFTLTYAGDKMADMPSSKFYPGGEVTESLRPVPDNFFEQTLYTLENVKVLTTSVSSSKATSKSFPLVRGSTISFSTDLIPWCV